MRKRHERLLFRYSAALERGDFDAVSAVLREAERDPALEAMILQLNDTYAEQSARFDHTNPKEFPMIAALYQNHKPTPARTPRRAYSLSFVAALAVVALVGVILATRLADSTIWNSAQQESPEAPVLQVVPAECALGTSDEPVLELYSRPSPDALVIHRYFGIYIPQTALTQLDAAEAEGQTWYFVSISDRGAEIRGWVTAETFNRNVRCATGVVEGIIVMATPVPVQPTVVPPNQLALPTFTPSPYNEESLWLTGEAMSTEATALPPTVVPPNQQALATFTPVPFQPEATAFPPTVVPPNQVALATATPFPLDPATPTLSPMVVPAAASDLPDFPVYFVREGDTLLSIVQMFGFDESMLDDLRSINNLTNDAVLTPGQALVIPVNMPDLVTTCVVKPDQTLSLLLQPSGGENTIVTTLSAGSSLEVISESQQADGLWVSVRAQMQGVTISGVWVRTDTLDFVTDCRTDFVATSELAAAAVIETPTLIPPVDPLAVASNSGDGYSCNLQTTQTINIQAAPGRGAQVIEQLPAGTPIAISAISYQEDGAWYVIGYRSRMGTRLSGIVDASLLDLPEEGCTYYGQDGSLYVPEATFVATATEPEFSYNWLTEGYLNCTVETELVTSVFHQPFPNAEVVDELPAGTSLNVSAASHRDDGVWYYVSYRALRGINLQRGFVAPGSITLSGNCSRSTLETTATPLPSMTPTPVS